MCKIALNEYTLDKEISKNFEIIINDIQIDPYGDPSEYSILVGQQLEKLLPEKIKNEIRKMNSTESPGLIIIHNFPIDSFIPETPRNSKRPPSRMFTKSKDDFTLAKSKGFVSEAAILAVGYLLNVDPFYEEEEKDRTIINQIIPINDSKYEDSLSTFGSKFELLPHTESIYQVPPLKYFSLLCLRGDPKVATSIIFFEKIISYISTFYPDRIEWVLNLISKPLFIMSSGPTHENSKSQVILPILEADGGREDILRLNLNPGRTVGITPEADEVVNFLREIITSEKFKRDNSEKIYLNSGDFILFKNWKVMHSRDAFSIDEDNWRWLQRCYFKDK